MDERVCQGMQRLWFVVRTNIKSEHKARREIRALGFDAYLPEYKIERFNRRKRVAITTTLCLFPRYLFVEVPSVTDLGRVRGCNGVEEFLPGRPLEPRAVPAQYVESLRQAQEDLLLDDTDEARRRRGETMQKTLAAMRKRLRNKQVRITDGPFANLPAMVERVESVRKLRVLISFMGRETPVGIGVEDIIELESAA